MNCIISDIWLRKRATSGDFLENTTTSPPIIAPKAAFDALIPTAKLSQLGHKAP